MIHKAKSILKKVVHKISKPTYRKFKHFNDSKLYLDNEYCLNYLKKERESITKFHCYWYGKVERKQFFSIKSVLVTQPFCEVWLWIDEETWDFNAQLIKQSIGIDRLKIIKYNGNLERMGTPYEELSLNHFSESENLAFRADAFRILILHKYGGLYFDLDILFLRDMSSLLDREFVYCWEREPYGNNALINLNQLDTFNNLLQIVKDNNSFQPWYIFSYANKLKNVWVLPSAYFDPLWSFNPSNSASVDLSNLKYEYPIINWDEFFTKEIESETSYLEFFPGCYAFHWHNRWGLEVTPNSYFDRFDKEFSKILNISL